MRITTMPDGLEAHIYNHQNGYNMYRDQDHSQPRRLLNGDVLSNGWRVTGNVVEAGNDQIGILFSNKKYRRVPALLPLQLLSGGVGIEPEDLKVGSILATGCVVLQKPPRESCVVSGGHGQNEVTLTLSGGRDGVVVGAPYDLELAVFDQLYPPDPTTLLGDFVLQNVQKLSTYARSNLAVVRA